MRKHGSIRLSAIFFLSVSFLLISACSAQGESTSAVTPQPTNTPIPTETIAPADTAAPTDTTVPTDTAEPTETEQTKKLLPRLQVERPDITMALPEGDPERGAKLGNARGCINCHVVGEKPPRLGADGELPAMLARAAMRLEDPAYTGLATTPEEYLLESITDPRIYEVDGDWEESMRDDYYDLPEQDLADIIAWMLTIE